MWLNRWISFFGSVESYWDVSVCIHCYCVFNKKKIENFAILTETSHMLSLSSDFHAIIYFPILSHRSDCPIKASVTKECVGSSQEYAALLIDHSFVLHSSFVSFDFWSSQYDSNNDDNINPVLPGVPMGLPQCHCVIEIAQVSRITLIPMCISIHDICHMLFVMEMLLKLHGPKMLRSLYLVVICRLF